MSVMKNFHKYGLWSKGTNASFIIIIPKIESPQKLDEYRPISLVGVFIRLFLKYWPIDLNPSH